MRVGEQLALLLLLLACRFPLSVADFLPTCCQLRPTSATRFNSDVDSVAEREHLALLVFSLTPPCVVASVAADVATRRRRRVRAMPANFGYLSEQKYF